jgi:hypothetical protein
MALVKQPDTHGIGLVPIHRQASGPGVEPDGRPSWRALLEASAGLLRRIKLIEEVGRGLRPRSLFLGVMPVSVRCNRDGHSKNHKGRSSDAGMPSAIRR